MFNLISQKILASRYAQKAVIAGFTLIVFAGGILTPLHQAHAFIFLPWLIGSGVIAAGGALTALFTETVADGVVTGVMWILALIAQIANQIMIAAGTLLDYVLEFSIRGGFLNEIGAIQIGWEVVRDLSNIFFIFILLFIAIATILQIEKYGTKALLAQVIIVALLINFSLFITKVVIDASNIVALQFYDSLTVSGGSISATIRDGLNLIQAYNTDELESLEDKTKVASIFFFLTALYLTTAWAFFMGALLFIGRLVAFIFLMILAPAAFLLSILPNTRKYYTQWWELLINQAVVAPLYLFVLFIVIRITQEDGFLQPINRDGVLEFDVALLFNFVIVIGLLLYGLKIVKQISGEFGARSIEYGKKATGFLAGTLIAGGGGALARATVGRSARWFAREKGGLQKASKGGGFGGRVARRALLGADYTSKAGFDIRGIKPVREGTRKLGIGLGKPRGKGGYEAIRKRDVEKITKRAEVFKEPEARARYAEDIKRGGIITGRLPGKLGEGRTIFSTMAGTTGARLEAANIFTRSEKIKSLKNERTGVETEIRTLKSEQATATTTHEELIRNLEETTGSQYEDIMSNFDSLQKRMSSLAQTFQRQGVPQERIESRVRTVLTPQEKILLEAGKNIKSSSENLATLGNKLEDLEEQKLPKINHTLESLEKKEKSGKEGGEVKKLEDLLKKVIREEEK